MEMTGKLNCFKLIVTFILFPIVLITLQTMPVSAVDPSLLSAGSDIEYEDSLNRTVGFHGIYGNPILYDMSSTEQQGDTEEEKSENTYNELGFSKIDISVLSQYVNVEHITEKQFYDMNFDMQIAAVTMTTDNDLLLRTTDNTYCTLKMSDEYIKAMELTCVVEKGSSLKISSTQEKPKSMFGTFLLVSFILSSVIFIVWFYSMNRRAFQPDKITVGAKEKNKNNAVTPEKKVTFNEVQGIDE